MKTYQLQCDRCGAIATTPTTNWVTMPMLELHRMDDTVKPSFPTYDIDLCKECALSLLRWMKQEVVA